MGIVDHYLNVYLILLMGIFQSVACGWVHCFEDSYAHSKPATLVLIVGYWALLVPLAWLAYFAFPNWSWTAIPIFWGWFFLVALVSMLVSMFVSKNTFKTWYNEIFFYGVKPISEHMCGLSKPAMRPVVKVIFEYWWCFSIKFVFPWAIWWLIIMTIKKDTTQLYEGYNIGWQVLGALLPIAGIILFLVPLIFAKGASPGTFKSAFAIKRESANDETQ